MLLPLSSTPEFHQILQFFELPDPMPPLVHCTRTREAAESILKGEVRCTRVEDFLDRAEYVHGLDVVRKTWIRLVGCEPQLEQVEDMFRGTYVLSLTHESNDFVSGKYGPYRVGFRDVDESFHGAVDVSISSATAPVIHGTPARYSLRVSPVVYDPGTQERLTELFVCGVARAVEAGTIGRETGFVRWIAGLLVTCFKLPQFADEQEVRAMVRYQDDAPIGEFEHTDEHGRRHIRVRFDPRGLFQADPASRS